jgi:hypothetical protein
MSLSNNTPAILNKITQAKNAAQAQFMSQKLYQGAQFFAFGHARLTGDGNLQILSNIFLDGLGPLWSATYAIVSVEHSITEESGYTCDIDVAANSLGGSSSDKTAAMNASNGGSTVQQQQYQYFVDQNPATSTPGLVQSPEQSLIPLPATDPLGNIVNGTSPTAQGAGVGGGP